MRIANKLCSPAGHPYSVTGRYCVKADGQARLVRRRETLDDLFGCDVNA